MKIEAIKKALPRIVSEYEVLREAMLAAEGDTAYIREAGKAAIDEYIRGRLVKLFQDGKDPHGPSGYTLDNLG